MAHKNEDEQLIEHLKSLPKIKDPTNKEELYWRISSKMKSKRGHIENKFETRKLRHQRPKKNFIPIFSMALVIGIVLLMLPSLLKQNGDRFANEPYTNLESVGENKNSDENVENDLTSEENNEQNTEPNQPETAIDENEEAYQTFTVTTDSNSKVVYGAVADSQLQYFIPISVTIPESENLENLYNRLGEYVKSSEWGVTEYPFENVTFDIDIDAKEVVMHLPDDFTIGEGSASAHSFEQILGHMFLPYGIDKINFSQEVDLGGHIGTISETDLQKQAEHYKIFQSDDDKRKFLIPIPAREKELTITEAFADMKNDEKEYDVYATIPNDVDFSLEVKESNLIVTFTSDTELAGNHTCVTMLEAMLMTAKGYGFETVTFEANIDTIGPYHMDQAIEVPDAVNPVN